MHGTLQVLTGDIQKNTRLPVESHTLVWATVQVGADPTRTAHHYQLSGTAVAPYHTGARLPLEEGVRDDRRFYRYELHRERDGVTTADGPSLVMVGQVQ